MFEGLSEKLQAVFDRLGRRGVLSEADVDVALREVRLALLAADLNLNPTGNHIDWALLIALFALCAVGVAMIFSTTSDPTRGNSHLYVTQVYAIGLGAIALVVGIVLMANFAVGADGGRSLEKVTGLIVSQGEGLKRKPVSR